VERVLPSPELKDRIADLAVGLASNCDFADTEVEELIRKHMKHARLLPFVAFVTPEFEWIAGFSGSERPEEILRIIEEVENSPLLQLPENRRKWIATLVERSKRSAEAGNWMRVMRNVRETRGVFGRSPERDALEAIADKARAWANGRFAAAIELAQTGGDLRDARKAIEEARKHFRKEPEYRDAGRGLSAIRRVAEIRKLEGDGEPDMALRKKAAEEYKGTPWAAAFEVKAPTDK
jgi:hypothetical protein